MDMMPVTPQRKAQLEEYAQMHNQTLAEALDDLLAAQLEWQQDDDNETKSYWKRKPIYKPDALGLPKRCISRCA